MYVGVYESRYYHLAGKAVIGVHFLPAELALYRGQVSYRDNGVTANGNRFGYRCDRVHGDNSALSKDRDSVVICAATATEYRQGENPD